MLDRALGGRGIIGGVTPDPTRQLLTIGDFAHQTRLTAKALRIYDEIGLLRPADVDPLNGHRRYAAGQVRLARLIGMLRGADMSLAEIGLLLADLSRDRELATARLERHLIGLEARHTSRRFLIRHIRAILREEEQPMFPIQTRHVPAQRVMSIQRRLRAPETDAFIEEAKAAFASHLGGATPAGPFTLIFRAPSRAGGDAVM
jgi:DNA-binding transcriptional MerR regulator